jgi:hypothetical protein
MPFMIPAGVKFVLRLWINIGTRAVNVYDPKPTAVVNNIYYKELNPYPAPALIL